MDPIKIKITGANAAVEQRPIITKGMVGLPVSFQFDESWEGFQKTAVFKAGGVSRDVVDVEDGCTVPPEVMTQPYRTLHIGIYGVQGNRVLPTVWANAGQILPGADPSGDPSAEPTMPLWQQLQQNMVRSVNGQTPDPETGNVEIPNGGGSAEGAVLYTEQELTPEQKRQVRRNIDVLGCDENHQYCGGRTLYGVGRMIFETEQELTLAIETYPREDERPAEFVFYGAKDDEPVRVGGVEDGIENHHAVNLGQLNAVVGDISAALDSIIAMQEELIGGDS